MVSDRHQQTRLVWVCVFLVILLGSLFARLLYIHFVAGERLNKQARAHYEYKEVLEASRGRIFDRNGELLASSQTVYSLVVDCTHLKDPALASMGLARKEQISPRSIRNKYSRAQLQDLYFDYVVDELVDKARRTKPELAEEIKAKGKGELVLARNIEEDYRRKLVAEFEEKGIGGVYLRKTQRRIYPSPDSLTHVLGYVGGDQKGREGIEKVFEQEMRGQDGHRICERDRRQHEIIAYRHEQVAPVAGNDVYLSIDMGLQAKVEQQLDKLVKTYSPEKVSTIWLKPATGEVLALANRPHFDLETRRGKRRNIAVSDVYQPGSTFKLVAFGAAFDRGLITRGDLINCYNGVYDQEAFTMKDHSSYGRISAELVLAKSSNIGTYMVARRLGESTFHQYIESFGFGRKTGIALTAESGGTVYPVKQWNRTSFSSMSIGYEIQATALQMAAACNVIANDGLYRTPVLVDRIQPREGAVSPKVAKAKPRRVISKSAATELRLCMQTAIADGTGKRAVMPGYSLAGKTGTARKHVENVGYVDGRYVVSFVGFLPAENPQLLGIIVIDDPRPKSPKIPISGGAIAAPAFKSIANEAIRILGIKPDRQ